MKKTFEFAKLTEEQVKFIVKSIFNKPFIKEDEVEKVYNVLELKDRDESQLRAIRNSVVKKLSEELEEYGDKFFIAENLLNNMSAITAVIDMILWSKGKEV